MTRILICSPPTTAIGGIARHTSTLLASLPNSRMFDQWWPLKDRVSSRSTRSLVHGLALARFMGRLLLMRPEAVHLQVSSPGIRRDSLYAQLSAWAGIPVVAHLHSEFLPHELDSLETIAGTSAAIIVLSEPTRSRVGDAYPAIREKLSVLPNPVAPELLSRPPASRPESPPLVLVMVGVICALKNQLDVVRVVSRLRERGMAVTLRLVGPMGSDLSASEEEEIRGASGVSLLGTLRGDELMAALDEAHAMVLFSSSEGEPLVVLEGMARALPVIASDVGTLRALLSGRGNRVVEAGDVRALEWELAQLGQDPSALRENGMQNRSWVARHRSLGAHLTELRQIYARAGIAVDPDKTRTLTD